MIRGGAEYSLGIYITGVDKGSEAESTGLKVRATPGQVEGELHTPGLQAQGSDTQLPLLLLCGAVSGEVSGVFQGRLVARFGF